MLLQKFTLLNQGIHSINIHIFKYYVHNVVNVGLKNKNKTLCKVLLNRKECENSVKIKKPVFTKML